MLLHHDRNVKNHDVHVAGVMIIAWMYPGPLPDIATMCLPQLNARNTKIVLSSVKIYKEKLQGVILFHFSDSEEDKNQPYFKMVLFYPFLV